MSASVDVSYAFMFSSLRDKPKETQGKVPCGGHFRIRQNLPEHTQSWLGSKWLWLVFIVVLYMILKFRGDGEKKKVQTPTTLRGCTFRPPGRKIASPNKNHAFNSLTRLEMDLVKFVSRGNLWRPSRDLPQSGDLGEAETGMELPGATGRP
ncbi:hypothetical protein R6Z07F_012406 [Ovis aries]